jgi:hypothetical protein
MEFMMRRRLIILGFILFILSFHSLYPVEMKLLKQWIHNVDVGGEISHCLLDKYSNIILVHRPGISLVNEKKITTFAEWGQGPDQINSVYAICDYQGDLAVFELNNQIKLFKMEGETYHEINKKWLKINPGIYFLRDAFYAQGRFFLGGLFTIKEEREKIYAALMMAYNDLSGQVEEKFGLVYYPKPSDHYIIRKHFAIYGDHLLFLPQNELKVYMISLNNLNLEKTVELKPPGFYIPMPKTFFLLKNYKDDNEYWKTIVTWMSSYSAVTRMVVLQNRYLILQIRTCNSKQKKFALLFYDINNNFFLSNVIYTNDLLLAGEGDKALLYFFNGGDPMIDEEAGKLIINIYQILH